MNINNKSSINIYPKDWKTHPIESIIQLHQSATLSLVRVQKFAIGRLGKEWQIQIQILHKHEKRKQVSKMLTYDHTQMS